MQARRAFSRIAISTWLMIAVSLLGLALRVEHALTFDQVNRASDYHAHMLGIEWTQAHWRPFFYAADANYQIRFYPPLWYFVSALTLKLNGNERVLVVLSLAGWLMRHLVLWRFLAQTIARQRLARLAALAIHALLPLSVLVDGKVNPEGLHSGIFALALYALWRVERQSQSGRGPSRTTAAAFGGLAGVALLTKATGALLIVVGGAVFGWQALCCTKREGAKIAWLRFAAPALCAATSWLVVAGWWCAVNLRKLGHPFPHIWETEGPADHGELVNPAFYRRPLGWALPFEWRQYLRFPMIQTLDEPRPNFWATEITGTWSDIYNRGFCRLKGGPITDRVWGGRHGAADQSSDVWAVTLRCVDWMSSMVHVGVWLSAGAVLALGWCAWQHLKTWGNRGSLAFVLAPLMCTASAMWFALSFPYDGAAALNPRYLLSAVMPMSACFGLALAELEAVRPRSGLTAALAKATVGLSLALIAVIGAMLIEERFGT